MGSQAAAMPLLQDPGCARPAGGWGGRPDLAGPLSAGTFITEWQEGGRQCEAFLAGDERSYQAVADQLVLIAQVLRFDGWLVNIENALSVSAAPAWRPPRPAAPPRVLASPRPGPHPSGSLSSGRGHRSFPVRASSPSPSHGARRSLARRCVRGPHAAELASPAPAGDTCPLLSLLGPHLGLAFATPSPLMRFAFLTALCVLPASERKDGRVSAWTLPSVAVG